MREIIRTQVISALLTALIIAALTLVAQKVQDGVLITLLGGATRADLKQIRSGTQQFGEWNDANLNVITQADSDGILVVRNGDREREGTPFWVCTHESEWELAGPDCGRRSEVPCSRGNPFDGATLPVRRGHFYKICVRADDREEERSRLALIVANWIPLVSSPR